MKVLSAIGRFFARIGRWIKETAWIQPLLIVGAIFAVIFAIPHIIDGVKGWFDESDSANKYFAKYQLSLKNADSIPDGKDVGSSKVDELFTYINDGNEEKIKSDYGERFFVAFVEENSSSCKDLYGGLKMFQDKWSAKNDEFNLNKNDENIDYGKFKLYTIYTDTISSDDDTVNLFDEVWSNHYELFETMSDGTYLPNTWYAKNKGYNADKYISAFTSDQESSDCPMSAPTLMFFDFTEQNPIENQKIKGLSDVIFSLDGSTDLERARTLKKCWTHTDLFGEKVD